MAIGKTVLGVLAGLAAGTVIGVLIAPNKEKRSRRNISKKSEGLVDAINERIDQKFEGLLSSFEGRVKDSKHSDLG